MSYKTHEAMADTNTESWRVGVDSAKDSENHWRCPNTGWLGLQNENRFK